jgi:hypothetical protein
MKPKQPLYYRYHWINSDNCFQLKTKVAQPD